MCSSSSCCLLLGFHCQTLVGFADLRLHFCTARSCVSLLGCLLKVNSVPSIIHTYLRNCYCLAFQLYVTLTTEEILLEVEKSSKLIWYYLLTYGLSLTVVAISLAIDPAAYTQSDFGVWMEPAGLFYCTFVTPILIFVLVN